MKIKICENNRDKLSKLKVSVHLIFCVCDRAHEYMLDNVPAHCRDGFIFKNRSSEHCLELHYLHDKRTTDQNNWYLVKLSKTNRKYVWTPNAQVSLSEDKYSKLLDHTIDHIGMDNFIIVLDQYLRDLEVNFPIPVRQTKLQLLKTLASSENETVQSALEHLLLAMKLAE